MGIRCTACGYDAGDSPPIVCPACNTYGTFEKPKKPESIIVRTCPGCGYIKKGEVPPEQCPVCLVPGTCFGWGLLPP